ncbi:MAG: hypothetical protein KAY46_19135 [Burkholderiaceae bacterium]|nr:hypothetical protein [Burkholderiaceae bacterium]
MFDDITREMAVQLLLDGYTMPTSQSLVNAILRAADPFSDRVVAAVIGNFSDGLVPGKDNAYPPQAPEFAAECRRMQGVLESRDMPKLRAVPDGMRTVGGGRFLVVPPGQPLPEGFRTIGPVSVSFGGKNLDLSEYHPAQKEWIIDHGRLPDSPDEIAEVEALAPQRRAMISHG